jgi:rubrerythrin
MTQNLALGLSEGNYLVEQVEIPPIVNGNVNVTVLPGTIALIGGVKYKGQEMPYKLVREVVGNKKNATTAYLLPDKLMDNISVAFFGGQHVVSISSLPTAKAKFSIVGNATVEVADFKELANYFKRSMTKEELVAEINANLRGHLTNEVSVAASKYITHTTTEVTLRAALDDVAREVISSKKTASALMNMGLILSARGLSMHINALDDAEDKIKLINDALADKAIANLDNDLLDRAADELERARNHDVNMALAKNTTTRNNNNNDTITTNNNGNAPVVINKGGNQPKPQGGKNFCPNCGAKITGNGRFCPNCGQQL